MSPPARPPPPSTSAPTCAPCRPPASWPRRWSRSCSPGPASRSSVATPSRRPRATTRPTSTASGRDCAHGERKQRGCDACAPRGRRGRPSGRRQDHRGPGARRAAGRRLPRRRRRHRGCRGSPHLRHLRRRRRVRLPRPRARRGGAGARRGAGRRVARRGSGYGPAHRGRARRPRGGLPRRRHRRREPAHRLRPFTPAAVGQPARLLGGDDEPAQTHLRAGGDRTRRHRRAHSRRGRRPGRRRTRGGSRVSGDAGPTTIPVGSDYDVVIGSAVLGRVANLLGPDVERVLLVHPPTLPEVAGRVASSLETAGYAVHLAEVPDAEAAKTATVAADLWARLGRAGFTRSDAVVGVGGGSVTDLAGFVAATWLRSVRVIQVPTTPLGMVDAAVGGKTGINTAEGKNLVGAFHPPAGVLCDVDVLATLPQADLVAGLAEVVKCGFIADPVILDLVESAVAEDAERARTAANPHLRELIERAVHVKAEVVAADLRESSLREILNYGHTFGHAVEQVEQYTWRHGEAVSVGMVYVAELARLTGHLAGPDGDALVARHRSVLESLGLPTTYAAGRWDELLTAMRRDKKARGSTLRFVVLDGLAQPARLAGPDDTLLHAAYGLVSRRVGAPAH